MIARTLGDEDLHSRGTEPVLFGDEMTELSLLLSNEQVRALEQAAYARGLTTAEMLRRLIRSFLLAGQCNGGNRLEGAVR